MTTTTTTNEESSSSPSSSSLVTNTAIVICTAPLVHKLAQARIPPNYIGTRRIAVSRGPLRSKNGMTISQTTTTTTTTTVIEGGDATNTAPLPPPPKQSSVVFKVTDPDGTERRMTRQEKKALRQKIAREKKRARLATKEEEQEQEQNNIFKKQKLETADDDDDDDDDFNDDENNMQESKTPSSSSTQPKYHQLSVNPTAMEQELAEFRGDRREGLPPVMLSPPMALCASNNNILPPLSNEASQRHARSKSNHTHRIQYDQVLSEQWARRLKDSMIPAETVRQGEDMRPMAYQLTPEAWTRMRPEVHLEEKMDTKIDSSIFFESATRRDATPLTNPIKDDSMETPSKDWLATVCRPPSRLDVAVAVIFDFLYQKTPLHVSCGAKFGSDFLVYDGPRSERHAFAGMRVLLPSEKENMKQLLPLPSAYDMAGYVRCLNTAGKLALLATVIEEEPLEATTNNNEDGASSSPSTLYRVAIVDVALEKILSAPTHQRHARTEKRRDIARNLAKRK